MPLNPAWEALSEPCVRDIVEQYLPAPQMQSMAGPFGSKTIYSISDFDKALASQDVEMMYSILNDAWLRAPEDSMVYNDRGFRILCNVCDGTIEGLTPDAA